MADQIIGISSEYLYMTFNVNFKVNKSKNSTIRRHSKMTSPQKWDFLTPYPLSPFVTSSIYPPPPLSPGQIVTNYFDEIVQESCQKIGGVLSPLIHLTLAQSPDLLILIKNSLLSRQELSRTWLTGQEFQVPRDKSWEGFSNSYIFDNFLW